MKTVTVKDLIEYLSENFFEDYTPVYLDRDEAEDEEEGYLNLEVALDILRNS